MDKRGQGWIRTGRRNENRGSMPNWGPMLRATELAYQVQQQVDGEAENIGYQGTVTVENLQSPSFYILLSHHNMFFASAFSSQLPYDQALPFPFYKCRNGNNSEWIKDLSWITYLVKLQNQD